MNLVENKTSPDIEAAILKVAYFLFEFKNNFHHFMKNV